MANINVIWLHDIKPLEANDNEVKNVVEELTSETNEPVYVCAYYSENISQFDGRRLVFVDDGVMYMAMVRGRYVIVIPDDVLYKKIYNIKRYICIY